MFELEGWGMIMIALFLFYASLGGLSGGGIHIPIVLAFFRYDMKNAVALSNLGICFASATRFLYNSGAAHPMKKGTGLIVDHSLSILMMPMIVSGVSFGVLLNIIMPTAIIIIVYALILLYLSYGVAKKSCQLWQKENE